MPFITAHEVYAVEAGVSLPFRSMCRTDMPVTRIAERIGYASVSYFYKVFSERYHQTPLEYRAIFNDSPQGS
ncbi:helix-turn-helix domain-containing protein [Bifidobacterium cebidarum]|uniref:HTH araC/xylS-type domain-containing protein n=1 Tax=Bifidobacterium cebidarum TaxID=2650773 RepID=A0A6I1G7E1_9BIFI|nr:helix-turn-helix domain-containing protein [Bifidobacterium cebidarum]KAB7786455.1 hypothetical protein F7D08_1765 [Bifidobacterium cebidarum]